MEIKLTDGLCKDKTVSHRGCFDAKAGDADPNSKKAYMDARVKDGNAYTKDKCVENDAVMCKQFDANSKPKPNVSITPGCSR